MTYPPQQPDPNQQPGQPYPQQPGQPYPQQPGQPYPQQPGAYPPPGYQAPPAPVPPKKGMGTGKLLLIIAACLVALCCVGGAIAAVAGGGKDSKNQSADSNKPAAVTTTAAAAAPTKAAPAKKAQPKLGQPARDGKFEFIVTNVEYGKAQVGDQYLNKAAQGQFVLVRVTVKNVGTEARTFTGATQRAFGEGGVKYENDGTAEIYANTDNQTFLNTINPGNEVKGILVFDIPKDKKITGVELHDSMFSGGVTVDLT
jgi:hypothetical protein